MRRFVTVVVAVALTLLTGIAAIWLFQRQFIYFPSQGLPDLAVVLPDAEEVTFHTEDGLTLAAWLVPPVGESDSVTVVMFNGNGGNRSDRVPLARALAANGYRVLLVDYRGYGQNPGRPTETGLLADGDAAVAYLEALPDIDAERLVYFGESLGAAVAVGVAAQRPPAALVLRSPFTSLPDVASVHYPFLPASILLWDRYPSVDKIRGIDTPALVVAGSADGVVPIGQSRRLYETAPGTKRFVTIKGADHNDFALTAGDELVAEVVTFIESATSR